MNESYRDFIFCARMIEQGNARAGYGPNAAWTAQDMRDMAASIAAEEHAPVKCPVCLETVGASQFSTVPVIGVHDDGTGRTCVASGQEFITAVNL